MKRFLLLAALAATHAAAAATGWAFARRALQPPPPTDAKGPADASAPALAALVADAARHRAVDKAGARREVVAALRAGAAGPDEQVDLAALSDEGSEAQLLRFAAVRDAAAAHRTGLPPDPLAFAGANRARLEAFAGGPGDWPPGRLREVRGRLHALGAAVASLRAAAKSAPPTEPSSNLPLLEVLRSAGGSRFAGLAPGPEAAGAWLTAEECRPLLAADELLAAAAPALRDGVPGLSGGAAGSLAWRRAAPELPGRIDAERRAARSEPAVRGVDLGPAYDALGRFLAVAARGGQAE